MMKADLCVVKGTSSQVHKLGHYTLTPEVPCSKVQCGALCMSAIFFALTPMGTQQVVDKPESA